MHQGLTNTNYSTLATLYYIDDQVTTLKKSSFKEPFKDLGKEEDQGLKEITANSLNALHRLTNDGSQLENLITWVTTGQLSHDLYDNDDDDDEW